MLERLCRCDVKIINVSNERINVDIYYSKAFQPSSFSAFAYMCVTNAYRRQQAIMSLYSETIQTT